MGTRPTPSSAPGECEQGMRVESRSQALIAAQMGPGLRQTRLCSLSVTHSAPGCVSIPDAGDNRQSQQSCPLDASTCTEAGRGAIDKPLRKPVVSGIGSRGGSQERSEWQSDLQSRG